MDSFTNSEQAQVSEDMRQLRAVEDAIYFDTCLIWADSPNSKNWYQNFQQLGNDTNISFFDTRSLGTVGPAYCNMKSAGQVDEGFIPDTIGVEFFIPSLSNAYIQTGTPDRYYQIDSQNYILFQELARHCSGMFQIADDMILEVPVVFLPAGYGAEARTAPLKNPITGDGTNQINTMYHTLTNGIPDTKNRWQWANGISLPKNERIKFTINFSDYARQCLQRMSGPGLIAYGDLGTPPAPEYQSNAACGIRVSLWGTRFNQFRSARSSI